jgi:hypothetical protein
MNGRWARLAAAIGSLLFAVAFFVPRDSTRRPLEMFQWTAEAAADSDTAGETISWSGVTLVIAYPYVWAVLVAAVCAVWGRWGWTTAPWVHLAAHSLGALVLAALSIMFLVLKDPWLPKAVQWTGATVPFVLLAIMWGAGLGLPRARRAGAVIALGYVLLLPLQLVLRHTCATRGEPAWGYTLAAAGATLAILGAAALRTGPRPAASGL